MLIVEDGSAKPDAESYASVAQADARWIAYNPDDDSWIDLDLVQKEAALRAATDYLELTYWDSWAGYRTTPTQRLCWPRIYVPLSDISGYGLPTPAYPAGIPTSAYYYPPNQIPPELVAACCDLAVKSRSGPLTADLGQAVLSETVGPISVTYDSASARQTQYSAVESSLAKYMTGSGTMMQLVRT